jgi:hypothetical protein
MKLPLGSDPIATLRRLEPEAPGRQDLSTARSLPWCYLQRARTGIAPESRPPRYSGNSWSWSELTTSGAQDSPGTPDSCGPYPSATQPDQVFNGIVTTSGRLHVNSTPREPHIQCQTGQPDPPIAIARDKQRKPYSKAPFLPLVLGQVSNAIFHGARTRSRKKEADRDLRLFM